MPLNLPADQVSIRGIKTASVAGVTKKPTSFQYQPTVLQKRVETFDADGYRIPGIPVAMSKDPKFSVGYSSVSPELIALVTADVDNFYTAAIKFATTGNDEMDFTAGEVVIDGQSLTIDPLQDTMQIGFICTDPSVVTFV